MWYGKPCCLYQTEFPITKNINLEYWQHPTMLTHRQDNLAGNELPSDCRACKQTELSGNYSRRNSWNERLGTEWQQPTSVIELDVQCDFSCNLACSICSPQFSTLWRQIDTKYKINNNKFKVRATNSNVLDLLETIPLHDIRQIHFQGGEPLMSNTHIQILEKLEKTVDLSQIVLWYHSNGTQQVSETVLKFWEKFKMVEIYFSLDDMGPRMEYQRWPINWTEVHKNMLWWKENLSNNTMLRIERTVSVLSAYWADELEQWHQQYFSHSKYGDAITINYHDCSGPYSLNAISELYRQALLEKFPAVHWIHKNVKNLKSDSDFDIKLMFDNLNHYDQVKSQNWKTTYPEFLKWYPEYAN
jgi:hypothetical protein